MNALEEKPIRDMTDSEKLAETLKLLKEARKIMLASSGRILNKDFLQRASDFLRRMKQ